MFELFIILTLLMFITMGFAAIEMILGIFAFIFVCLLGLVVGVCTITVGILKLLTAPFRR